MYAQDTLEQWRAELTKEPAGFTSAEALETLGLNAADAPFEESRIRKSYFKMAQKYHPDKNPEGKEMFQKINKAYEYLASNKAPLINRAMKVCDVFEFEHLKGPWFLVIDIKKIVLFWSKTLSVFKVENALSEIFYDAVFNWY